MSNVKISDRAKKIREHLSSKERFADALSLIGIEVSKDFTCALRKERTKSTKIYNTGTCYDFGAGGGRMDFVDIIKEIENLSMSLAVKRAEELLGIQDDGTASYEFKAPVFTKGSSKEGEYDDTPLKESYIKYFREQYYSHKAKADTHLKKLLPTADEGQRLKIVSKFEMGYDPKNDKITIPVRSVKGQIMNLAKYTSTPGTTDDGKMVPKLKYLYGRKRVLFNLQVLKSAPKVVYIFEGEKDVLNATLNGLSAITQGAASGWKSWMAQSIVKACEYYKVNIPKFIILQDHDKPGVLSTLRIFKDIKEIQPETKMMFWERATIDNLSKNEKVMPYVKDMAVLNQSLTVIPKGYDYTDYKSATA